MGQKVRPTGFRIGIFEDWRSRWYAPKKEFGDLLVEDQKIREYVKNKYPLAGIPRVEIERTRDQVVVHLFTARPGVVIGRRGEQVDRLREDLENLTGRRMDVKVIEVNQPFRSATLVAEDIARQLVKRGSFRRTMKQALDQVMDAGAYGVKIELAGRLGGAEMSRTEKASRGSVPLSTIRRHIDYGFALARTAQGAIGVKVWIDLGDYDEETNDGTHATTRQASKGAKKTHKR